MKILVLAPYIYSSKYKEFTRNKTGFGMMVEEIADHLSNHHSVDILTRTLTKRYNSSYTIQSHKLFHLFYGLTLLLIIKSLRYFFVKRISFINRFRYVFYILDSGYTKRVLKKIKPDIVHIHGAGFVTLLYMETCSELGIPFVLTLHGLIGIDKGVKASEYEKNIERKLIENSYNQNIHISVVSSKMLEDIKKHYNIINDENIHVIGNFSKIPTTNFEMIDIRKLHNINEKDEIILVIGNISYLKNQKFIIQSLDFINQQDKLNWKLLFIGNDNSKNSIINEVTKSKDKSKLIVCGHVDKKLLPNYYIQAKLNIVASLSEGFGLSIIEGFKFGVPTLTFSDIYAFHDIYDKFAVYEVKDRDLKIFSTSMVHAMNIYWDAEKIISHSKKFDADIIIQKYIDLYDVCLNKEQSYEKNQ